MDWEVVCWIVICVVSIVVAGYLFSGPSDLYLSKDALKDYQDKDQAERPSFFARAATKFFEKYLTFQFSRDIIKKNKGEKKNV